MKKTNGNNANFQVMCKLFYLLIKNSKNANLPNLQTHYMLWRVSGSGDYAWCGACKDLLFKGFFLGKNDPNSPDF
jgi:hypothetical protein